jgi:hypothetical protein
MDPGSERGRRPTVPQVVGPDAIGQTGLTGELLEPAIEPIRLDWGAVLLGEDKVVVFLPPGPRAPFLDLGDPPGSQGRRGDWARTITWATAAPVLSILVPSASKARFSTLMSFW